MEDLGGEVTLGGRGWVVCPNGQADAEEAIFVRGSTRSIHLSLEVCTSGMTRDGGRGGERGGQEVK